MRLTYLRHCWQSGLHWFLLALIPESLSAGATDWLLDPSGYTATVTSSKAEIILQNGLVRRTFRVAPNATTVALDHLVTGASLLRAVEPEAALTIDGQD